MSQLTELQPVKKKKVPLIKPRSSGMVEKALVVGGGLCVAYTFAATLPIASGAALLAIGAYFLDEIKSFQPREKAEELDAILNAKTPKHASINEIKSILKSQYPVEALNAAIESMIGHCEMVYFRTSDKHPLAPFGSVFCWCNPDDPADVKLPLERIEELFRAWGIIPTIETASEAIEQSSAVPALPQVDQAVAASQDALIQRLLTDCPELLKLVKAPPIRCVGAQRTGKTTLAKKLALLRLILLPGHQIIAAAPHIEAYERYPDVFKRVGIAGGRRDYPAIADEWEALQQQIYNCETRSVTHIWDEFGSYGDVMPEATLTNGLTSTLREATKHGSHPIFILHGETLAFMPGGKGLSNVILRGTVRVETIGETTPPFGEMKPTGCFTIHWLDGAKSEGKIPDWLTEEFLLKLLSGNAVIDIPNTVESPTQLQVEQPTQLQVEQPTQLQPDTPLVEQIENLNKVVEEEPHEAVEDESKESNVQIQRVLTKVLVRLSESNGEWVNSRDLIKTCFRDPDDRELAKLVIQRGIKLGRIELQEKENQNNTVSKLVRLKPGFN